MSLYVRSSRSVSQVSQSRNICVHIMTVNTSMWPGGGGGDGGGGAAGGIK